MGERTTHHLIEVSVRPPYTVQIGAGALAELPAVVHHRAVALVSDSNVAPRFLPDISAALELAGIHVTRHVVPAGEGSKSAARWLELQRAFARAGLDRDGAVVAVGGGVVGDLAGFAAATYLRGIAWYQAPTSLLAMVDASVGGKTAIDLPEGKNLAGAFWQPLAVLADVRALRSLPEREFRQGAVEHFKHGLLADSAILDAFADGFAAGWPEVDLARSIARSVAVKAAIVAQDEREGGVRAHLNLGHTLAHALEAVSGHVLPHGDAVAYGLHFAALVGRNRGWADLTDRTAWLLAWVRPSPLPRATFQEVRRYQARDKKHRAGRERFVLLQDVGRPLVTDDVSEPEQERAWNELVEEVGA